MYLCSNAFLVRCLENISYWGPIWLSNLFTGAARPTSTDWLRGYQSHSSEFPTVSLSGLIANRIGWMSRWKWENVCRIGSMTIACLISIASLFDSKPKLPSCGTVLGAGDSGRLYKDPQIPSGGLLYKRTWWFSLVKINIAIDRIGTSLVGFRPGKFSVVLSWYAKQSWRSGQMSQAGLLRTQTVAPRSIIAWV